MPNLLLMSRILCVGLAWLLGLQAALAAAQPRDIVINELMTSNGESIVDENGDSSDWFELLNAGTAPVNLSGWGVSDDKSRPFKWVFDNATLQPGEFMVVFASGKDRQPRATSSLAPTNLAGLRLWLRADGVDTNDAAQVRRVGSDVFVRQWIDQSGRGNHAVQPDGARQPTISKVGLNGICALRFDGVNDMLALPRVLATNSFCLFVVFRTSQSHEVDAESSGDVGGVSGQRYLFGAQHGGDYNAGMGVSVGTNGISVYEHGSSYMPALAVYRGPVGTGPVVAAVNYDAKQVAIDFQGLPVRTGLKSVRAQVTAPVEIGAGAYGAFGGELAEVLLYDRPLSENERRGVGAYLAGKYGILVSAPRHTNFQLDADGEELQLTRPDMTVADYIKFGPVPRDVSFGRKPDAGEQLMFFVQPTPGSANLTDGSTEFLGPPEFSVPGGFYSNAINLQLSVPNTGAEIRYTLDGSEPTESSPLYTVPLQLTNRAGTKNDLSLIPTVPGGPTPVGEVFKGWVVRARAFKAGALPSSIVTRTFWIDARGRARYTLPVVSIATHRANFFDPDVGIYVPGNAPGGNYSQRGPEWERPVHIELYETNNVLAFAQEADAKIHGNTSQGFPIKGLDIDGTGGRGRKPFKYKLFPGKDRTEFEHFLLRPTGHDQLYAFMRDELQQSLAAEIGAETQAARPCIVFINGEYWGLHYLKEKEDAEFISWYADHPADDIDYLEGYASAKAGDTLHYNAMIAYVGEHDLSQPEAYAHVQSLMDVPNYIDYKVCEIFNYRWDIGNHRLWRPRTPEGRWRWLQFDNDVGWGGFWAEQPAWEFNMLEADLTPNESLHGHNNETTTFLLRRLIANADFKRDFVNRFADLLNTTLHPSNTVARINEMAAELAPEMAEHIRRWRTHSSAAEWNSNVQYLRMYAMNRPGFCRQHLIRRFGLGETVVLSAGVSDTNAGSLKVNSLAISAPASAPWCGIYFKNHPVTLVARPRLGWRLAGWDNLPGLSSTNITLLLQSDFALNAMFELDPTVRPKFTNAQRLVDNSLSLDIHGLPNAVYRIQTMRTIGNWELLGTVATDQLGRAQWKTQIDRNTQIRIYRLELAER